MRQSYDYLVYQTGSTVTAISGIDGSVVTTGATLDPVLTTLLANGAKSTYVQPATYNLSGSFAGWNISTTKTKVVFDVNAGIVVPNGYTGYVFKLLPTSSASLNYVTIEGGHFAEAGSPAHLWKWLWLSGSVAGKGISYNVFRDSVIWRPSVGIFLEVSNGTSWINTNSFENMQMYDSQVFVEMSNGGTLPISDNVFININGASSSITTHGFKNVCSARNMFIGCHIWDINSGMPGALLMNINSDATDTLILGGIITTSPYFTNNGTNTRALSGNRIYGASVTEQDVQNVISAYRPVQTTGTNGRVGFAFNFQNTTPAEYTGGTLVVEPTVATAAAESAFFEVYLKNAGTLTRLFDIGNDGRVYCGGTNRRIILSDTGLSAQRTITFNDANTVVVGEANTQTLAAKTLTTPVINGLTYGDVAITSASSPYTVLATTGVIRADASGGAITINLPTAVGIAGRAYKIYRTDIANSTNIITIDGNSTETIDSNLTYRLYNGEWVHLESDGANWQVIARPTPNMSGYYGLHNNASITQIGGLAATNAAGLLTSTTSPAANLLWALPTIVARTRKFDSIQFNATSVSTAGNSRVGLYADTGNSYPGKLIFDSGAVDTTSTGVKTTTITSSLQILQPGLYWLAYEADTATGQIRILPGTTFVNNIIGANLASASGSVYAYTVAHTFGALPDPYTAGGSLINTASAAGAPVPAVGLHPV